MVGLTPLKGGTVLTFDGFPQDAHDDLSTAARQYFGINLTTVEVSTRGYNWGQTEFEGIHDHTISSLSLGFLYFIYI